MKTKGIGCDRSCAQRKLPDEFAAAIGWFVHEFQAIQ
jgi:hypothetical protein